MPHFAADPTPAAPKHEAAPAAAAPHFEHKTGETAPLFGAQPLETPAAAPAAAPAKPAAPAPQPQAEAPKPQAAASQPNVWNFSGTFDEETIRNLQTPAYLAQQGTPLIALFAARIAGA